MNEHDVIKKHIEEYAQAETREKLEELGDRCFKISNVTSNIAITASGITLLGMIARSKPVQIVGAVATFGALALSKSAGKVSSDIDMYYILADEDKDDEDDFEDDWDFDDETKYGEPYDTGEPWDDPDSADEVAEKMGGVDVDVTEESYTESGEHGVHDTIPDDGESASATAEA